MPRPCSWRTRRRGTRCVRRSERHGYSVASGFARRARSGRCALCRSWGGEKSAAPRCHCLAAAPRHDEDAGTARALVGRRRARPRAQAGLHAGYSAQASLCACALRVRRPCLRSPGFCLRPPGRLAAGLVRKFVGCPPPPHLPPRSKVRALGPVRPPAAPPGGLPLGRFGSRVVRCGCAGRPAAVRPLRGRPRRLRRLRVKTCGGGALAARWRPAGARPASPACAP